METTKTPKKPIKRTRADPTKSKQLVKASLQADEVLTPRQAALEKVCLLTSAGKATAMQIASSRLREYCEMVDEDILEFVNSLEPVDLMCDCLAFGMPHEQSKSLSDPHSEQVAWLLHFIKEYKKAKATLVSTRKKPDMSVWSTKPAVMRWQAVALECDIEPSEIDLEDIEDFLSPDLHEFRYKLGEATEAARKDRMLQALLDGIGGKCGVTIIHF
jgi:hypothetical protein